VVLPVALVDAAVASTKRDQDAGSARAVLPERD